MITNDCEVALPPDRALDLWLDTARWPTFVEGFAHVEERDPDWPHPGSKVVWQSRPGGRGRVTERVEAVAPGELVMAVFEDALHGTQTLRFEPGDQGGSHVLLALDYELQSGGPLRKVTDALFIRRALSDAQKRTLRRFATEAAEEGQL
jgi:hypothetical protein